MNGPSLSDDSAAEILTGASTTGTTGFTNTYIYQLVLKDIIHVFKIRQPHDIPPL